MKDPQYLDESFQKVCQEMLEIFIRKHNDYGKGNIMDTGQLGILFRVNDKLSRIKHLTSTKTKPINESIEDTWIDIAVYAVIAVLYLRGWFQRLKLR